MINNEKTLLSWEVIKEKRDSNTFLFIGTIFLIAVAAIVYYFIQKDYYAMAVFIVLILVLAWYFFASPKNAAVAITDQGFKINNQSYKFVNFKSFWISKKTGIFYFEPKSRVGSTISMPNGNKNPEEIIGYFPESLIETEDKGDDFINRIADIFKI